MIQKIQIPNPKPITKKKTYLIKRQRRTTTLPKIPRVKRTIKKKRGLKKRKLEIGIFMQGNKNPEVHKKF